MSFKQFLLENDEHFIHHIAEEELIACKVHKVSIKDKMIKIVADCRDKPRKPGFQNDLTDKLNNRLAKHKNLKGMKAKVHHEVDARHPFDTTPDRAVYSHPLNVIAK